ncbi:metallophosphoesterase family protein [Bacteroides sp.]
MRKLFILYLMGVLLILASCQKNTGNAHQTTPAKQIVRIGMITDVHGGIQDDAPARLKAFIDRAIAEKPDFIIQLGDLTHGKDMSTMLDIWNQYPGKKYHVIGNHELDYASKEDIVTQQNMPGKYYSFDAEAFHFVVLDCNYILKDGKYLDFDHANYYITKGFRDLISPEQIEWLKKDIASTDKPVVIFSHQGFDELWDGNTVPNRIPVREIVKEANQLAGEHNKVIAFFCGHHHVDSYSMIEGVHYFQMNSASGFWGDADYKDPLFAFVTLDNTNHTLTVEGVKSEFVPHTPTAEEFHEYNLVAPEKPDSLCANINDRVVKY